jgi:hypothetical protein
MPDPRDPAVLLEDADGRHALEHGSTLHACALGQRHRHVDGVDHSVFLDVEAGEDVVDPCDREEPLDLGG